MGLSIRRWVGGDEMPRSKELNAMEIERLVLLSRSGTVMERKSSIIALSNVMNEDIAKEVPGWLSDENTFVLFEAIAVAGNSRLPNAVPGLKKLLGDERLAIRLKTLNALGRIGGGSIVPSFLEMLKDPEPVVRRETCRVLGELRAGSAIQGLMGALGSDPDDSVKISAGLALSGFQEPSVISGVTDLLLHGEDNTRRAAVVSIREMKDPSSFSALMSSIRDPDVMVRKVTIETLTRLGNTGAVPKIIESLEDPEPSIQLAALEALRIFKDPSSLKPVLRLMQADDPNLADLAAEVVGLLQIKTCIPELVSYSKSWNLSLRVRAVNALGQLRDPDVIPGLGDALLDQSVEPAHAALRALAGFNQLDIVPYLVLGLESKHDSIRTRIHSLLSGMQMKNVNAFLENQLKDPRVSKRVQAVKGLGLLRDPSTIAVLESLPEDPDPEVREAIARILGDLKSSIRLLGVLKKTAIWTAILIPASWLISSLGPDLKGFFIKPHPKGTTAVDFLLSNKRNRYEYEPLKEFPGPKDSAFTVEVKSSDRTEAGLVVVQEVFNRANGIEERETELLVASAEKVEKLSMDPAVNRKSIFFIVPVNGKTALWREETEDGHELITSEFGKVRTPYRTYDECLVVRRSIRNKGTPALFKKFYYAKGVGLVSIQVVNSDESFKTVAWNLIDP